MHYELHYCKITITPEPLHSSNNYMGSPALYKKLLNYGITVDIDFLAGKSIVIDGLNLFHNLMSSGNDYDKKEQALHETNSMIS